MGDEHRAELCRQTSQAARMLNARSMHGGMHAGPQYCRITLLPPPPPPPQPHPGAGKGMCDDGLA